MSECSAIPATHSFAGKGDAHACAQRSEVSARNAGGQMPRPHIRSCENVLGAITADGAIVVHVLKGDPAGLGIESDWRAAHCPRAVMRIQSPRQTFIGINYPHRARVFIGFLGSYGSHITLRALTLAELPILA